ncbi:MAG: nucleoside hydrolase [Bryobacteraceae bacterium]
MSQVRKSWILAVAAGAILTAAPVPVIFDTDMGNDIDDALALAVIHALESRGEARLLAVTLTKDNRHAAPYCDLVNHFYRRGHVPIGVVRGGKTPKDSPMIQVPVERRRADGRFVYPRSLDDYRNAPEAAALIRGILESAEDGSVVIVQVGFSTNLARLLAMPGAVDLVRRKVRLLSVMAGEFPTGKAEYNVKTDIPAASRVFADWPTPIVASGFEIGKAILYPAASIQQDFGYVENHPVAEAYRNYQKMPYDRPTWDLTAVLYALRPNRDYFSLSAAGTIRVDAEGKTTLEPSASGRHRYLIVNEQQKARTLEALVQLASQPPVD